MTTEENTIDLNLKCGDCQNFKIKEGETHFNCVVAKNAGFQFGMQVRADSRSCDAYVQK